MSGVTVYVIDGEGSAAIVAKLLNQENDFVHIIAHDPGSGDELELPDVLLERLAVPEPLLREIEFKQRTLVDDRAELPVPTFWEQHRGHGTRVTKALRGPIGKGRR